MRPRGLHALRDARTTAASWYNVGMPPETPAGGVEPLPESCAAIARERAEPLAGTASRVDVWLLLSVPEPWGAKALPESSLPEPAKARLQAVVDSTPDARVLLIKSEGRRLDAGPLLFVAHSGPAAPRLYRIPLKAYTELADWDLAPFLASDPGVSQYSVAGPLFLTCTNGRRDPCCARLGLPVYRALRTAAKNEVWQCSHVGGHRFAANVVVFPHGLYYGRVGPEDAGGLVSATRGGRLLLPHLRGRSSYDPPVQAAEVLLLGALGADGLDHLRLLNSAPLGEGRWAVTFRDRQTELRHSLIVEAQESEELARFSCQGEKLTPVTRYRIEP